MERSGRCWERIGRDSERGAKEWMEDDWKGLGEDWRRMNGRERTLKEIGERLEEIEIERTAKEWIAEACERF